MMILLACLMLLSPSFVKAEIYTISNDKVYVRTHNRYNFSNPKPLGISYDTSTNETIISYLEPGWDLHIVMNRQAKVQLVKHIFKFIDWSKTAKSNNAILTKEIGNLNFKGLFSTGSEDDWLRSEPGGSNATLIFLSQTAQQHQLLMSFEEFTYEIESSFKRKPEDLYFDENEALHLLKEMEVGYIETMVNQRLKEREMSDTMFK